MDDIEREAIRDEGYHPDDPAVVAAIDCVRWELSMLGTQHVNADLRRLRSRLSSSALRTMIT